MRLKEIYYRFFSDHLKRQMRELYVSTAILNFGVSMVQIFEPIYLYTIGFSLKQIIIFFVASYVVYFLVVPLGGKFARTHGYEHSLSLSTPFLIIYFISLFSIPRHPAFIVTAIFSLAIFKMFYWPGYRALLARYTDDHHAGRALSGLSVLSTVSAIVAPIAGGALLTVTSFPVLFITASAIILLSTIPLLRTPEVFEPHDLSYVDAYKRLFRPEFRRALFAHFGYGEEFIESFIFPIFILLIIPSYLGIGAVVTGATLVMLVVTIIIGRVTDEHHRHPILRTGVLFTVLAWAAKMVVSSAFGVLIAQSLYMGGRITIGIPFVTLASKRARKYSVMKSVVFYEMSITIGKILTGIVALVILHFASPGWWPIFAFGGLLTLLYALY
jgi:MFS family permease